MRMEVIISLRDDPFCWSGFSACEIRFVTNDVWRHRLNSEHDYPTQLHLLGLALILQSDSYLHVRAAGNNFRLCACKSFFCLPFLPSPSHPLLLSTTCFQSTLSKYWNQIDKPDCNGVNCTQSLFNRRLVVTLMTDYPKIRLSPITDILIC